MTEGRTTMDPTGHRVADVPLRVDSQVRFSIGFMVLTIRSFMVLGLATPLAVGCLTIPFFSPTYRLAGMFAVYTLAYVASLFDEEGVWKGTTAFYRYVEQWLPQYKSGGIALRARVQALGEVLRVGRSFPQARWLERVGSVRGFTTVPRMTAVAPGVFHLEPGGARAIVAFDGPPVSLLSDAYLSWCQSLMSWLLAVDCPCQLVTMMSHFDGTEAKQAFDDAIDPHWPPSPLLDAERSLVEELADESLGYFRHYAIFAPMLAGRDGIPYGSRPTRLAAPREPGAVEAEKALDTAIRLAPGFGVAATPIAPDEIDRLSAATLLGCDRAIAGQGALRIGDEHHVISTVTGLPARAIDGIAVRALRAARCTGTASLHVLPVAPQHAVKEMERRQALYRYAARQGGGDVAGQVAMGEAAGVMTQLAQKQLVPVRIALSFSCVHPQRQEALAAADRLRASLTGSGFRVERPTTPGFVPALAVSPGSPPLARSLILTSESVALRLVPALGTPFSNPRESLLGVNLATDAPAYMDLWNARRANQNMIALCSSGGGKSTLLMTMFARYMMRGASGIVIDPESEYRPLIEALGGVYFELGQENLNVLEAGCRETPDAAANLALPVLSVMAGDRVGVRNGRPIRRLSDEDQGWLFGEISDFYRGWRGDEPKEPVLTDLVTFLSGSVQVKHDSGELTAQEFERARVVIARLRRYTQGGLAEVFDRPSSFTFSLGDRPVGVGLRSLAMTYGADLTPALASVLTAVLASITRCNRPMILVIDEAHEATGDPDASMVLAKIARKARKYLWALWCASQCVEDFVETDFGLTLAATASTKVILGVEEQPLERVAAVFQLRPHEVEKLNPIVPGQAVIVSGAERAAVQIVPSWVISALASPRQLMRPTA